MLFRSRPVITTFTTTRLSSWTASTARGSTTSPSWEGMSSSIPSISRRGVTGAAPTIGIPVSISEVTTRPIGDGAGASTGDGVGDGARTGDGIRVGGIRDGMTIGITGIPTTLTDPIRIPAAGTVTARTHRGTHHPHPAAHHRAAAYVPVRPHRGAVPPPVP